MAPRLSFIEQKKVDRAFFRAMRTEKLTEQHGRCAYCHELLSASEVTADHVHPKIKGGLDKADNILAACRHCNKIKGSMSAPQFVKRIKHPNGAALSFYHVWLRRKLNLRIERAERRILASVGRAA